MCSTTKKITKSPFIFLSRASNSYFVLNLYANDNISLLQRRLLHIINDNVNKISNIGSLKF